MPLIWCVPVGQSANTYMQNYGITCLKGCASQIDVLEDEKKKYSKMKRKMCLNVLECTYNFVSIKYKNWKLVGIFLVVVCW